MKRFKALGVGAVLCVLVALACVPAAVGATPAGARANGAGGGYSRTFSEAYLKGLALSGGYFSCLKSQPPYTFFWQDWYGTKLAELLDQKVGIQPAATGIRVWAKDGYYVDLGIDEFRNANSQGFYAILAWQYGEANAAHKDPPLTALDSGDIGGPFRLVVPQHPDTGDYASGGDPNWQFSVKWVRAIEVDPLPPGMAPVDPSTIPEGQVLVYGRLRTLAITKAAPDYGLAGTEVTIVGYGFGAGRGSSRVSFGGVDATEYESWSDTRVRCEVPEGASGRVGLTLTRGSETSNAMPFSVSSEPPPPPKTFYFAEGTCRPGFDPYLCIQNPGTTDAAVKITYMKGDGTSQPQALTVPKSSRVTVVVKDTLGEGNDPAHDFSAKVETTNKTDIIAERPMYFKYQGYSSLGWTGGHDVIGATAPAPTFYFAEGTCRPGFDPYLCIQNPGTTDAAVKITYMKGDGTSQPQALTVPKSSRVTVVVKDTLGEGNDPAHDFSAKVETTNKTDIIAERPMYFNYQGYSSLGWTGGHDVIGATAPAPTFYFAEGTCRPGFDPYLCIQNPGTTDAAVKITYMKGDGTSQPQALTVPKSSRVTVVVKDTLGEGNDPAHDFSAKVETTNKTDIIAERPMYFNYQGYSSLGWTGGHDVIGATAPAPTFYFAEGTCRPGFDPYLCIQNPGTTDAAVKITYMKGDGTSQPQALTVPKSSRVTVVVKDTLGEGNDPAHDFSAKVETTNKTDIIAERPMYFNYQGACTGGHDVVGYTP